MILNKTFVKTTNNFKINELNVDIDLLPIKCDRLDITKLDGISIKSSIKSNFDSNIGLKSDKYNSTTIDVLNSVSKNIYVKYNFKEKVFLSNELILNLNENTDSSFIILFTGGSSINNFKIVINGKRNSKSNISVINISDSNSFISFENELLDNSSVYCNLIDLGGKLRVSNYYSSLIGNNTVNYLNNIYMGLDNNRIDCNYYIKCVGKNTKGYIYSYGVLDDNSYKIFKGTIDFVSGCVNSIGEEIEKCILLSDTCKSKSLPMLLCSEENVIGNHGVSTGKIDKDQIFYLMSKGISEMDSKKLIVMGNFNQIIDNINDKEIKQKIIDKISDNLI